MPRRRRVSAKTFSSIFPCFPELHLLFGSCRYSLAIPAAFFQRSSFPRKAFLHGHLLWLIAPCLNLTFEIQLVRNTAKKFSNVIHQRRRFRFTQISQRHFFENVLHRLDARAQVSTSRWVRGDIPLPCVPGLRSIPTNGPSSTCKTSLTVMASGGRASI